MSQARRRGQPLAVLGILLGGWILARAVLWQSPFPLSAALAATVAAKIAAAPLLVDRGAADARAPVDRRPPAVSPAGRGARPIAPHLGVDRPPDGRSPALAARALALIGARSGLAAYPAPDPGPPPGARRDGSPFEPAPRMPGAAPARWSGDGWLLLRPGSSGRLAAAPVAGRYGGSQAGAVVRYRLSSGDRRPALFARSSAALGSVAERELALGIAARPLAALSARAQLELRARSAGGSVRFAPAAALVSEVAPLALPLAFEAEPYLEAGYVGGRFATPFVGGQLRVDRAVARLGAEGRVRLGAGAWGGAQEGAAALDLGPGATIELPLGEMRARLTLDYRLRIAGDAEPGSGPALTLSTGF